MRRRHFFPADAVAITGDIVQDEPEAYGTIELLFDGLGVPVLLIPGNHDEPAEMERRLGARAVPGRWRIPDGQRLAGAAARFVVCGILRR